MQPIEIAHRKVHLGFLGNHGYASELLVVFFIKIDEICIFMCDIDASKEHAF